MSEEKGIECVKGYGMISFVKSGNIDKCPISGASYCERCYVIPSDEAKKDKQVKREEGHEPKSNRPSRY